MLYLQNRAFGDLLMNIEEVQKIVLSAVEELNLQMGENLRLELNDDTQLFGRGSKLDSLGLVNLIVLVEEKVSDHFGRSITLADERAMSQKSSPFRTVKSLSEYILTLLLEDQND
jgi:acyl carrier protein